MGNLFDEFDSVSYQQWLEKIEIDLKGKSIDLLHSQPERHIELKAYHHRDEHNYDEISGGFGSNPDWEIRQTFDDSSSNEEILQALNEGVNHLGLKYSGKELFAKQTKDVLFEHIGSDISFESLNQASEFQSDAPHDLRFDCIELNLRAGNWNHSLEDYSTFVKTHPASSTIWVSGKIYGDSGASTIQELAFTLAHANAYFHHLLEDGQSLESIVEKLRIALSLGNNFFVSIAKMRAVRELFQLLLQAYSPELRLPTLKIYGSTGVRHLCQNDHNNNLLRQTAQCASAAIGGCNVITVRSLEKDAKSTRLSKNIQLILKEESYLNKVMDASSGAYAIENITDQLIEKAWTLFQSIEEDGGLIQNILNGSVQSSIEENKNYLIDQLQSGESTLLGINKQQNKAESWVPPIENSSNNDGDFPALLEFKLEAEFDQKVASDG